MQKCRDTYLSVDLFILGHFTFMFITVEICLYRFEYNFFVEMYFRNLIESTLFLLFEKFIQYLCSLFILLYLHMLQVA